MCRDIRIMSEDDVLGLLRRRGMIFQWFIPDAFFDEETRTIVFVGGRPCKMNNILTLLHHEVLHAVLYKLFGLKVTKALDLICDCATKNQWIWWGRR